MEKLLVGPLKVTAIPTLIVIDTLNKCKDKEPVSAIQSILSCYVDQVPNVKFSSARMEKTYLCLFPVFS